MSANPITTILVVEDEDTVRESICAYLEDRGFAMQQAGNGKQAVEIVRRQCPDLMLLDLRMPEMSGLDVLSVVTVEASDMPVVVISGTGAIAPVVEALHRGAWDYIQKPIEDMAILIYSIEKSLERARLLRQEREYRKQLEAEVKRRTAEMERFVYTVSHDLKSPLITIKGYVGLLQEDITTGSQEAIEDDLARITRAADRMERQLMELLDLSRVGRVVNPPEDVPLHDLVQEAIEMLRGPIDARQVQIDVAPDLPVIYGDRTRLREVLQNLVENAVRYMGRQQHPRVEITPRDVDGETACCVCDNGIGIDPRYHERIFGLFEKLDPQSEGTGMGLALVKRIVEVHGGRVWVESEGDGKGSTFCFTLPRRPTPPTEQETPK